MSTQQPSTSTTPSPPREITVYSHSTLFYWWPVWAVGFVLAMITLMQGTQMGIVPKDSKIEKIPIKGDDNKLEERYAYVAPEGKEIPKADYLLAVSRQPGLGVIFAMVLLIVILITNVPLRGLWSVLILSTIFFLGIIFYLAGWWDEILRAIKWLDIRINTGGYLFISLGLLGMWLFAFFFFDRQIYITFVPGQMKIRQEIGEGEKTYDTRGMTIEKLRGDILRHVCLGLGSGDMVIRTSGADPHEFRLNNVLRVSNTLQIIEGMQRMHQEPNL